MLPPVRRIAVVIVALAVVTALAACAGDADPVGAQATRAPSATPDPSPTPTPTPAPTQLPSPSETAAPPVQPVAPAPAPPSIDDPASLSVVVNKLRPLQPADYAPGDLVEVSVPFVNQNVLRREASEAVTALFAGFQAQTGLRMQVQSAYRDYATQVRVYDGWVTQLGQAGADSTSARPGYSEHQTGLALDISGLPATCALDACFADTPQGQWLAANAWSYGFVLRYPAGGTAITGYEFEPWHYRYVGVATAADYHAKGATTLEQYFGLPAAPTYAG